VERFGEKAGGWLWGRFTVHSTPKHRSWLNQAEIEISLFSRQCLGPRRIPSLGDLQREARAWNRRMNRDRVTIGWRVTAKRHARSSATKETTSRGQRPSVLAEIAKQSRLRDRPALAELRSPARLLLPATKEQNFAFCSPPRTVALVPAAETV
jgi:hypothetical protein